MLLLAFLNGKLNNDANKVIKKYSNVPKRVDLESRHSPVAVAHGKLHHLRDFFDMQLQSKGLLLLFLPSQDGPLFL